MTYQEIVANDKQFYMNTFGNRVPVCFTRGEGAKLYDTQGREYDDFFAGIAVNSLGYNHPAVKEALIAQVETGIWHTSNVFYTEPQQKLVKLLCENSPFDRAFISNSGTEAVEGAIKLARKFFFEKDENRNRVVSALGSFHGRTIAAVAATGQPKYQEPYKEMLPPAIVNVPFNNIDALREAVSDGQTCAVLLECIQGEGGIIPAKKEYLQAVRALCDELGILLIFDEIQTGIGRTGKLFCFEHYGVVPDIVTVAKALGNGVPIGAFLSTENVAAAFKPGDHGSTFGGNPLACSAACAVLETMLSGDLFEKTLEMGEYIRSKIRSIYAPQIVDVRGMGLLTGVQLSPDTPAAQIQAAFMRRGFVVGAAGNNTLRLTPPLIIEKEAVDRLLAAARQIATEGY